MARSSLTLAALATSAVPELDAVTTAAFGSGRGDYDSALLTGRDGRHWIIRIPGNSRAEAEQSADVVAIRALSTGVRTRLPFSVPVFAGQVPVGETRGIVYEFVYGSKISLGSLDLPLAGSVGSAIAAIHSLPTGFIVDAGLPVLSALECLRSCVTVADRAAATGLLPASLIGRWERALEDTTLWQFQPTVINGAISAGSLLAKDGTVSAILGWQDLRVGDPARDLQWLLGSRNEPVIESTLGAYERLRGHGDRQLMQRAKLYSELELAKWLLHGAEVRNTEIVDDAVEMLTGLVENLRSDVMNPISSPSAVTMDLSDLEDMLDNTRRAAI